MKKVARKFIEINEYENNEIRNSWLEYCRSEFLPYIVITTEEKSASVEWDHLSYPMEQENIFLKKNPRLEEGLLRIAKMYGSDDLISEPHSTFNIQNLSVDDARSAASEIFDLISSIYQNSQE